MYISMYFMYVMSYAKNKEFQKKKSSPHSLWQIYDRITAMRDHVLSVTARARQIVGAFNGSADRTWVDSIVNTHMWALATSIFIELSVCYNI